jgi:hypothetical protein
MRCSVVVYTRDVRVPLSDDDREMEHGWRMIPIAPTSDTENWVIVDTSSDRRTGRARRDMLAALATRCGHA